MALQDAAGPMGDICVSSEVAGLQPVAVQAGRLRELLKRAQATVEATSSTSRKGKLSSAPPGPKKVDAKEVGHA